MSMKEVIIPRFYGVGLILYECQITDTNTCVEQVGEMGIEAKTPLTIEEAVRLADVSYVQGHEKYLLIQGLIKGDISQAMEYIDNRRPDFRRLEIAKVEMNFWTNALLHEKCWDILTEHRARITELYAKLLPNITSKSFYHNDRR